MQSLELNLATRPFHNNTLYWLGYGLGAVLLLTVTFWNASAYIDYSQRLKNLAEIEGTIEKKTAELQRRDHAAQRAIENVNLPELATQAAKANDVIAAKAFSWTRLFNQLENVLPYTVRMLSVRPQFRFGQGGRRQADNVPEGAVPVSVEGIARDLRAILDFERSLIEDVHFSRVDPDRHSRTPEGETLFTLRFLYYPEGDPVEIERRAAAEAAALAEAEAAAAEAAALAEAEAAADEEVTPPAEDLGTETTADDPDDTAEPDAEPPRGPQPGGDEVRVESRRSQANVVESRPPEPRRADPPIPPGSAQDDNPAEGEQEPVDDEDESEDDDEEGVD